MKTINRSSVLLDCVTGGESRLTVETGIPNAEPGITIIERKGLGHPDTLADHLAEALSRAYAKHTLEAVGAVLHHNFDKLALLGGSSRVSYGGGSMGDPVRVLVNGRATRTCGDLTIPVDDIVNSTVAEFFAERLPHLGSHYVVELNITSNSSPGAVHGAAGTPERTSWFTPTSVEQLRERKVVLANDTSMGTAFAPLNDIESFVIALANDFSGPSDFTQDRPWCGTDVKVMAFADDDRCDIVFCVPQISAFVHSRDDYSRNCTEVIQYAETLAASMLPERKVTLRLNARDMVDRDEIYLTLTGSSIESGDEGVVGRGNRACGMITPLRPMNLEGVNGKNPVYHVGKVYNIAARRIASALHTRFGGYVEVHLISATGQALASPWQAIVRMADSLADHTDVQLEVTAILSQFPQLTEDLVAGRELTA
ncbi:methionine adenosyltransferase [Catelliglobosispora koreensis]|uniref:methionine adenosyltransferase n=1 Tax=Catelliglobosispora koreensis TaxID=129052 RepID=UPI000364AF0F|nr:methionine adenosyltransferase [Catelliglobosispora koreensis]